MNHRDFFSYKKQAYYLSNSTALLIIEENRQKTLVDRYMTSVFSSQNWKDIVSFLEGYIYKRKKN